MRIGIIGGGASCVALLSQLQATGLTKPEIVIFETSGRVGPGNAYRMDEDTALLNRPISEMSIHSDNRSSFVSWLAQSEHLDVLPATYAPRRLFGEYIHDQFNNLKNQWHPGTVTVLPQRVDTVHRHGSGTVLREHP